MSDFKGITLALVAVLIGVYDLQTPSSPDGSLVNVEKYDWPGFPPKALVEEVNPYLQAFRQAVKARDEKHTQIQRRKLTDKLGRYAGSPEVDPGYIPQVDIREPDLEKVITAWNASVSQYVGRHPWEKALPNGRSGLDVPRLRDSLRQALGYLRATEAGLTADRSSLSLAEDAFDYLLKVQAPSGVFGYPTASVPSDRIAKYVNNLQKRASASGKEIVWNDWIIDDLGEGGLMFDNGMVGVGLVYIYWITGEHRYLEAAEKAAQWAMQQPYVDNFNYNSFSGYLLARLYRVTGKRLYLDAADELFTYAVLSGQMENGRWFDPHNARIQYHSVMIRSLVEYYLALQLAESEKANSVEQAIRLGLDNLADEITTYGISNPHEMLSLDALVLGMSAIEESPHWRDAANANVNYMVNGYWRTLLEHDRPVPSSIATYLMYRNKESVSMSGFEFRVQPGRPQPTLTAESGS